MSQAWYVQNPTGFEGPISAAELKLRASTRLISRQTVLRLGENGKYVQAGKVQGLFSDIETEDSNEVKTKGKDNASMGATSENRPPILVAKRIQSKTLSKVQLIWKSQASKFKSLAWE